MNAVSFSNAAKTWSPAQLIDLDRYPITDLSAPRARALAAECRRQLDQTGACELPAFLRPEAVQSCVAEAEKLANALPSNTCSIYGKPFADIFASVGGDFYKIDASLFSPALVTVSNLDSGASFHAGRLAPDIVDASFR